MADQRVKCSDCDNQILPETVDRNAGLCGVCKRKQRKQASKIALDNDIAVIRYAEEFHTLRSMTRDVVHKVFVDLETICNGDHIYGLCIYALGPFGSPVFCGSTLTGFAKRESKLRANTRLQEMLPNTPVQEIVYTVGKWSPYEWEHEAHRWQDFSAIAEYLQNISPRVDGSSGWEFHAMALAAYVACLYDLDMEGLFKQHRQSSSLVLFCSDCESTHREWYQHASAKFLNPAASFSIFFNESIVFDASEENHNRELLGDECQRRFNRYLQLIDTASNVG